MSRSNASPWGFRLHGGADFGTPLTIQKVRPPSNTSIIINAPKEVFMLSNRSESKATCRTNQYFCYRNCIPISNFITNYSSCGLISQSFVLYAKKGRKCGIPHKKIYPVRFFRRFFGNYKQILAEILSQTKNLAALDKIIVIEAYLCQIFFLA